ncbi:hypothetical protein OPT61_g9660 [Boeremia exigua]|uniref:Uncharacterized protein n=1 Tax=Boeremia exigua TaxID=749465 RepID=A0ACC2HT44_9PLEO|nr:hypothetical protein OPT61_g9660 [Boeremia exigua]
MFPSRAQCAKKNLLLCFDAFGTLFQPNIPIPTAYTQAAIKHGVPCSSNRTSQVIHRTFQKWLEPGQDVPQGLVDELMRRYSTQEGYVMFADVQPFFQMLRNKASSKGNAWPWEKTIVGIITNSDDRVPGILTSFGLEVGPRRVGTLPDQRPAEAASQDDISFVVLSYDVGVEKPDRGMFDAAVECLKETLEQRDDGLQVASFEKLYIGDSLKHDVVGAQRAGWNALMLDRTAHYKGVFAKEEKDLVRMVMKPQGTYDYVEVGVLNNLKALKEWSPPNSTSSSGSDDKSTI